MKLKLNSIYIIELSFFYYKIYFKIIYKENYFKLLKWVRALIGNLTASTYRMFSQQSSCYDYKYLVIIHLVCWLTVRGKLG